MYSSLKKKTMSVQIVFLSGFLVLISLFSRSFVGLSYQGLLLGELIVGFGFVLSGIILLSPKNIFAKNNISNELFIVHKLIVITFIISTLYFESNYFDTYIYKTSSYIWMASYMFYSGFLFRDKADAKILASTIWVCQPFLYLFSTGQYPDKVILFFNTYSDKFQFPKASDTLLVLIISNLLIKKFYRAYYLHTLFSSTALFLPLFLFQSRGTFISLIAFLFIEIIFNSKIIFVSLKSIWYLIIFFIIFTLSSFHTSGLSYEEDIFLENSTISQEISESVIKLANKNDQRNVFLSFYFMDGRLYSEDTTTNWRLDIWQDVVLDLRTKEQILIGYGYDSIIPVMLDLSKPGRLGRDGNNENVHNFIINILARGGVMQILFFVVFYFFIFKSSFKTSSMYYVYPLVVPSLLNGLTDINFEGVQFPFLYYIMLGFFIKDKS